ncbi:hypothetical protein PIB30_078869 [Stylosanthes scabra]|uniref:Uncharacterized protein n=1 Tax=Stylosanthes scabra TaxID=79078 RepID=A0ABU6TT68_9FABA|nr:hypothetical protein [Stylosanthes scabra]
MEAFLLRLWRWWKVEYFDCIPHFEGKMKKGSLQSKKRSLEAKKSKNSKHMRGRARICVLLYTHPRLSNSVTLRHGTLTSSFPRICVGNQQLTFQSHVYTTSNVTFTSPSLIHRRIGVEDPHICVEGTLAASNHAEPMPESFERDSKPR